MFANLHTLAGGALMERIVLLVNHVLASEPIAMQRLVAHAGRSVEVHFTDWPALLPALPPTRFSITPAGLVEWSRGAAATVADLNVHVDASNPASIALRSLGGECPRIDIQGDAALAGDVDWLIQNLRWDIEDDLAKRVGAGPARQVAQLASAIAQALRGAARGLSALAARARGEARGPPPR